jgi:PilZ domain
MEQRQHPRWPANLDVALTRVDEPRDTTTGRIVNVSESGIRVRVSMQVLPGAIVKLEMAECVLFGQVIHCCHYSSAYELGIEVVRVLIGQSDLARLVNAVLAESMPTLPGVTVDC